MKKYKNRKDAVKMVVAVLCAACMLTACGSKETTSNETASTETTSAETTSVESTEITTTEETVAEPTVEPTGRDTDFLSTPLQNRGRNFVRSKRRSTYTSSGTLYLFLRLNHSETITQKWF